MTEASADICDVAIVGYGPVGALLANLLGREGVRTAVIEREREVYRLPRAVHFDHEVMRIFQSVGLPADVLPETAPIEGYEFWNAKREILFRFPIGQEVTHQGWRRDYMFHQPALEEALRARAATRSSVAAHLGWEVIGLDQGESHVALEVRDLETGEVRSLRARFVVGCDGANSFVRKRAGLRLDDLQFDEPWLVADAKLMKSRKTVGLPGPVVQLCDPARPVTFVPVAGPYIRWEFMLKPGETKEEMLRPERVRELIAAWADPREVEVIRTAVYDFHALVAKRWNTARVFLAGDSAHQMPPFLGQGMCAGIRDACNLAWKLGLVLRGAVSTGILSSYQSERDPHVRAVIGVAIEMGRIICTQDPAAATARDASFLGREERELTAPDLPGIGPGLLQPGSPLAGKLGLQARVRGTDGFVGLLDDVLGARFVVLSRQSIDPQLRDPARQVLEAVGGRWAVVNPSFDVDGAYERWLEHSDCDAVLIRPDHVVFGTGSGSDAASALLEELGRALRPSP